MLAAHQDHLREDFPLSSLREAPLELQTHPRPCTQPAPLKAPVFYVKLRKATSWGHCVQLRTWWPAHGWVRSQGTGWTMVLEVPA